ncbi:MAG: uracil-DNA glycosylase [Capsulimonas sp.]|jgi:uracil-DNA glycosylase family 4|uniref:uracil-DNA glycosylase n=1 Tax=Capsulimonas sp. TaxID=2494211 RepID=UPI0032667D7E|nr:uracil-DNA glycosylase, family 4 [Capsulimonas sp.]
MAEPATDREEKIRRIELLSQRASTCPACDLSQTRTHVVFGDGNAGSPLMLVGEGPGANEDATGVPFVGRAGKLLDECLREAGMLRKHVYITNVVKCRATLIADGRIQNRPPRPEESGTCVPLWLEKQIEIIQPRVILCLGAPAANAIIHKNFRMLQERGQWQESKYVKYAMAALHPAYILRQEGEAYIASRQFLIDDLIAAREKTIAAKNEPRATLF